MSRLLPVLPAVLLIVSCYERILLLQDGLDGKDLFKISVYGREADFDLQEIEKIKLEGMQISDYQHPSVKKWIDYYTGNGRPWLEKVFERAGSYIPTVKRIFEEKEFPPDFVYLPIVESGYNPHAMSPARALGMWQFMYATGILYGLKGDYWRDDRKDVIKSTYAATLHLRYLYREFGSWLMALAAYNAGGGRIGRGVKKYKTSNFWKLCEYNYLKNETKNYVPKFIAVSVIAKNPRAYGFREIYEQQADLQSFTVEDATDLGVIAECAGLSIDEIKTWNTALLRWATPPGTKYEIRLPSRVISNFTEKFSKIDPGDRVTYRRYQIKMGESLSVIAEKFNVPVNPVAHLNKLTSIHSISAGNFIFIPIKGLANAKKSDQSVAVKNPDEKHLSSILYAVKPEDTLYKIALRYSMELSDIMRWNNMPSIYSLQPGDLILLKIPEGS